MDIGAGILAGGQGLAGGITRLGDLMRDEREKEAFRELLMRNNIGMQPQQQMQTMPQQYQPLAQIGQPQPQPMQQNPGNATTSQLGPQVSPANRGVSQGFANEFGNKWAQQPGAIGGSVPSLAGVAAPQMRGLEGGSSPQQIAQSQRSMNGALPQSLYGSESGGNFRAQNSVVGAGGQVGHFGRAQFGQARLAEAAAAGAIPQGTTPQAFMASPELQQRAEAWHVQDINNFISQNGLDRAIGQQINGVTITLPGMQAVAHLGGNAGLKRFIETGGQYNPSDANGTSLMAYLAQHGGGQVQTNPLAGVQPMQSGGSTPAPQQGQPMTLAQLSQPQGQQPQFDMQTLGALMTNKYGAPLAQQILAKQLGRDPMQMALQQEQLRSAQLGNQRLQSEMSGEGAKLQQIDMGDSIGFVNQKGELVRSIQKNISQKPVTLGEGQQLVNPVTGAVVAGGDQKPKLTESQSKDLSFYQRGVLAENTLSANEPLLANREQAARANPLAWGTKGMQELGENIGRAVGPKEYQSALQASRDVVSVLLRKDSGAAITEPEWAYARKTWIPVPGDGPEMVAQKRASRQEALNSIKLGLGKADSLATARINGGQKPGDGLLEIGRSTEVDGVKIQRIR
jgi:hypothetical protein